MWCAERDCRSAFTASTGTLLPSSTRLRMTRWCESTMLTVLCPGCATKVAGGPRSGPEMVIGRPGVAGKPVRRQAVPILAGGEHERIAGAKAFQHSADSRPALPRTRPPRRRSRARRHATATKARSWPWRGRPPGTTAVPATAARTASAEQPRQRGPGTLELGEGPLLDQPAVVEDEDAIELPREVRAPERPDDGAPPGPAPARRAARAISVAGSRPDVGSLKTRMSGFFMMPRAIARRCRCE